MREPARPWTRTTKRVAKKAFVKGVPDAKIHQFEMGDSARFRSGGFDTAFDLVLGDTVQIRDNALESSRLIANKYFETRILLNNYFFKVLVYPHQCIREHTMQSGAGADRLSSGMKHAFGRPIGRAAVVRKGQAVMRVWTTKEHAEKAREGLARAACKIPGRAHVVSGVGQLAFKNNWKAPC
ncbi:50S ribosomal protein L16 [Candidatus Micrarchaeota archaeon]|nr:50S ribosomal protein L16 [Candidatus Micrarchaeota archaeon]